MAAVRVTTSAQGVQKIVDKVHLTAQGVLSPIVILVCFAGLEGSSLDDLAAQMEAAAEQLAAAKRAAEARRREEAIMEVEMVLQTYFHNLDNSYNKLQTINEYMDDVEVSHPADSPNPEALTFFFTRVSLGFRESGLRISWSRLQGRAPS